MKLASCTEVDEKILSYYFFIRVKYCSGFCFILRHLKYFFANYFFSFIVKFYGNVYKSFHG